MIIKCEILQSPMILHQSLLFIDIAMNDTWRKRMFMFKETHVQFHVHCT